MEISMTFRLGGEERDDKLERAQACARELSSIACSWHNKKPRVHVAMDREGELKWALNDVCCEAFGREIAKAIEEVGPKL